MASNDLEDDLSGFLLSIHPLYIIGTAILLIFMCAVIYVFQSGLLARIDVKTVEPVRGPMVVAYKTGKGSYKNAGELFTDACSIVFNRQHIGIYYDDPEAVAEDDLRYAVGTILAQGFPFYSVTKFTKLLIFLCFQVLTNLIQKSLPQW
jgi:hypothetical protein